MRVLIQERKGIIVGNFEIVIESYMSLLWEELEIDGER